LDDEEAFFPREKKRLRASSELSEPSRVSRATAPAMATAPRMVWREACSPRRILLQKMAKASSAVERMDATVPGMTFSAARRMP
jgi:hypothetical protein